MIPKSVQPGEIINEGDLPEIDDLKRAAGAWSRDLISGMPVGWFVTRLFQRAAVPAESELWKTVEWTHPSHQDECERLPSPFPPDNWESLVDDLQSVGDWLTLLSKIQIVIRIAGTPATPEPSPYDADNAASIFTDSASHSGVRPAVTPADSPAANEQSSNETAIALPGETEAPPSEEPPADQ